MTPSDYAQIPAACSCIGRMNTQKKSASNSIRFWKYDRLKIWPDPPSLDIARRVKDIFELWTIIFQVSNIIQGSKLLLWVIATQILRICSQKHCILLSFYGRGTTICTFITHDCTDCDNRGHVVSKREMVGRSDCIYIKSRYLCISHNRYRLKK